MAASAGERGNRSLRQKSIMTLTELQKVGILTLAAIPFAVTIWVYGRSAKRVPQFALALWRLGAAFQYWACRYAHPHDFMLEEWDSASQKEPEQPKIEKESPSFPLPKPDLKRGRFLSISSRI